MSETGRHVLVTGASRGLGRAIAEALAGPGTTLSLVSRDPVALEQSSARCRDLGAAADWYQCDLTSEAALLDLREQVRAASGPVDVLFANAGAGLFAPVADTAEAALRSQLDSNVVSTFLTCKTFAADMRAGRGGKIVTTSSDLGLRGEANWAAYAASKAAVIAMSKSMAWEWAPHVTVNVLAPGAFATDLNADLLAREGVLEHLEAAIPLGRVGAARELAGVARLLAGPDSDYMTGSVVTVTGGVGRF